MSKIVVCTMISIDGYTEGPGGNVMAMPMDLVFAEHNVDRMRAAGHVLFGGTTYRGMVQYWPRQVDNPNDNTVWADQTAIVRRADAHAAVHTLRNNDDEADVLIFGSRTLWTNLLTQGLHLRDVRSWSDSGNVVLHYSAGNAK